jgi:hypothetical protein
MAQGSPVSEGETAAPRQIEVEEFDGFGPNKPDASRLIYLKSSYVPWNATLDFHTFYEYSTVPRLQSAAYDMSFAIKF